MMSGESAPHIISHIMRLVLAIVIVLGLSGCRDYVVEPDPPGGTIGPGPTLPAPPDGEQMYLKGPDSVDVFEEGVHHFRGEQILEADSYRWTWSSADRGSVSRLTGYEQRTFAVRPNEAGVVRFTIRAFDAEGRTIRTGHRDVVLYSSH